MIKNSLTLTMTVTDRVYRGILYFFGMRIGTLLFFIVFHSYETKPNKFGFADEVNRVHTFGLQASVSRYGWSYIVFLFQISNLST